MAFFTSDAIFFVPGVEPLIEMSAHTDRFRQTRVAEHAVVAAKKREIGRTGAFLLRCRSGKGPDEGRRAEQDNQFQSGHNKYFSTDAIDCVESPTTMRENSQ